MLKCLVEGEFTSIVYASEVDDQPFASLTLEEVGPARYVLEQCDNVLPRFNGSSELVSTVQLKHLSVLQQLHQREVLAIVHDVNEPGAAQCSHPFNNCGNGTASPKDIQSLKVPMGDDG